MRALVSRLPVHRLSATPWNNALRKENGEPLQSFLSTRKALMAVNNAGGPRVFDAGDTGAHQLYFL
jgi:hypothetical protein